MVVIWTKSGLLLEAWVAMGFVSDMVNKKDEGMGKVLEFLKSW